MIAAKRVLSTADVEDLHEVGFIVVPGPIKPAGLRALAEAYDLAVAKYCFSEAD